MVGQRSAKGCWTCRLRRKKCDETTPSCQTCSSLGIACQGYGPRPSWMDRGLREREKAEDVKAAIAQNSHKRKTSQSSLTKPFTQIDTDGASFVDSRRASMSLTKPARSPKIPRVLEIASNVASPFFEDSRHEQLAISTSPNNPSIDDWMMWQNDVTLGVSGIGNDVVSTAEDFSPNELAFDDIHFPYYVLDGSNQSPEDLAMPLVSSQLGENSHGARVSTVDVDYGVCRQTGRQPIQENPVPRQDSSLVSIASGLTCSSLQSSCSSRSSKAEYCQCSVCPGEFSIENATLLSHYLEKVLPVQFPFGDGNGAGSPQWLLILLFSSKSVLDISLALSRTHYALEMNLDGTQHSNNGEDGLAEAMNILKTLPSSMATMSLFDGERRVSQTIIACTSLVHTIFLEILHGGSCRWEYCLTQAAPYMQILIDFVASANSHRNLPNTSSDSTYKVQLAAVKTLFSQLVWFDVLATVSTGSGPFLGINHSYLLNSVTIDIKAVSGCPNWVAEALCKISALQQWKAQAEDDRKLSIIELATRGGAVLQSINDYIGLLNATVRSSQSGGDICKVKNHSDTSTNWNQGAEKEITLVFARAAIIYLHVVISGPNPHLEEIRRVLPELISSFKNLASKKVMGYTAWPLCVTACFADEEERRVLLDCLDPERSNSNGRTFKMCTEALNIAQECHAMRKAGVSSDWALAMKNLDRRILLG